MTSSTKDYSEQFQPNGRYEDLSKEACVNLMQQAWWRVCMQLEIEWRRLVEEKYGIEAAKELNPITWERIAPKDIKWLREATGITGDDVVSFARILNYDIGFPQPVFDYSWEFKGPNYGILTIRRCRGLEFYQREGKKAGKDYTHWLCHEYEPRAYGAYATAHNQKMKTTPLKLPPQGPGEPACQWEFKIEE
jgi:hypothetical protein